MPQGTVRWFDAERGFGFLAPEDDSPVLASARTMEVTPSMSVRTVKPATPVANHRKVCRRENAGRSRQIAFHQCSHSDIGLARCCF